MSILPSDLQTLIEFMENHGNQWATAFASIGLTTGQAASFKTAALTARANYTAQTTAMDTAKSATKTQQSSTRAAKVQCADLLKIIKAYALTQPNPQTVYTAAMIPPPAVPAPAAPPGTPTDFTASLEPDGAVTLRWKAVNVSGASGTVWTVKRKVAGETSFTFIGAVGLRKFTDETLPAGPASVQYVIQGQRAEAVGTASTPFTVLFGTGGPGLTITSQFSGEAEVKQAA